LVKFSNSYESSDKLHAMSMKIRTTLSDPYHERIGYRIKECLRDGPQTLQTIVRNCRGAYPTVVLECLRQLSVEVSFENTGFVLNNPSSIRREASVLDSLEGNPVLCSWYFTPTSCNKIAQLRDWSSLRLAFLGTPRLYDWFAINGLGKKRLLLDLDEVVLSRLKDRPNWTTETEILRYDVASELPQEYQGQFDWVFFDPPWYPNEYELWISRASLLAPKGFAAFPLFQDLTRPDAHNERKTIIEFVGNHTSDPFLVDCFLDYDIPSYELAQLRAAGLQSVQPWRVADLVLTTLPSGVIHVKYVSSSAPSDWHEVDIGSMRLFVGPVKLPSNQFQLLTHTPDGASVLASPSRRERPRSEANVLSSRGHGLATDSPKDLIILLETIRRGYDQGIPVSEVLQRTIVDTGTKGLLENILLEV
jgi:hypothetical protein